MESPCESESSLDGGTMLPPSPVSREQLQKRIESLTQQNKWVLITMDYEFKNFLKKILIFYYIEFLRRNWILWK